MDINYQYVVMSSYHDNNTTWDYTSVAVFDDPLAAQSFIDMRLLKYKSDHPNCYDHMLPFSHIEKTPYFTRENPE